MSLPALVLLTATALTGASSPEAKALSFEGRTAVMPYAPNVPEGWARIVDTQKVDPRAPNSRLEHGEYPHFVVVEHLGGADAKDGGKFLRIRLMGGAARLDTRIPIAVEARFSYAFGGWYRAAIPADLRPTGRKDARTRIIMEVRFAAKDGRLLDAPPVRRAVDLEPGVSGWTPLPECLADNLPEGAATAVLSLIVRSRDFAGHVDIDALHFRSEPRVHLKTGKPSNLFGNGEAIALSMTAKGLPEGPLNSELTILNHEGRVVYESRGRIEPVAGGYEAALPLPEMGRGWFTAEVRLTNDAGKVAGSGTTFAIMRGVSRSSNVGLVVEAREGPPPYMDALQAGFLVFHLTREELGEAAKHAARMREAAKSAGVPKGNLYAWLDCPFEEEILRAAVPDLSRDAGGGLILPKEYDDKNLQPLLKDATRREILRMDSDGSVYEVPSRERVRKERVRFVVINTAADLSIPDIVWRAAELKASGAGGVAYTLPTSDEAPPPEVVAAAYWLPKIMEAEFEGGSGIARDVHTLLFTHKAGSFLLYRSLAEGKQQTFTVAAGNRPELAGRNLMGNLFEVRGRATDLLDIDVPAGRHSAALEGVDLGLLKTSMSVALTEGMRLVSRYEFQPLAVSFQNHLTENMSAVVVPRLPAGWRMKPALSGEEKSVPREDKAEFRFRLRPGLYAEPGRHYVAFEIYPRSLQGGKFTVFKHITLDSPITLTTSVKPMDDRKISLTVEAALSAGFERTPGVMQVGIRTPFGTSHSRILGLVPGGRARPVEPSFVLPAGEQDYTVELWLTERGGGLFHNATRTITPVAERTPW